MAANGLRIALAAAVLLVALAAGCKSKTTSAPTATATATAAPSVTAQPSPTHTPVPMDRAQAASFRGFAADLQAALGNRDATFLDGKIKLSSGICTEADVQGGIGAAPCTTVGAPWSGFLVGMWRSEGGIVPDFGGTTFLQGLYDQALPAESDGFGDGAPRVYAIGLSSTSPATVITELIARPANYSGSGPLRIVKVLSWAYDEGRWKATFLLHASVLGEEFLIPCQAGLDYLGGVWERYPAGATTGGLGPTACLEGH